MSETINSVIQFLESKASDVTLTEAESQSLVSELREQINQVSIDVPNARPNSVTVLYSGIVGGGVHGGAVAQQLLEQYFG